ncbi:MAG TPA: hypothetical protein VLT81_09460 [Chondromyces sp.]|nr:hypothetical protein [Chondromyces sp.]
MADSEMNRETERILEEIDRTREGLDNALGQLGERLDPVRALTTLRRVVAKAAADQPVAALAGALLVGVLAGLALGRRG